MLTQINCVRHDVNSMANVNNITHIILTKLALVFYVAHLNPVEERGQVVCVGGACGVRACVRACVRVLHININVVDK